MYDVGVMSVYVKAEACADRFPLIPKTHGAAAALQRGGARTRRQLKLRLQSPAPLATLIVSLHQPS